MSILSGLLINLFCLFYLVSPAKAVPIDYIDSVVDRIAQTVNWTVQFMSAPSFTTLDQYNRQQDSFQIMAWDDPRRDNLGASLFGEANVGRSVIRGEELHYGNGLPIRDMPNLVAAYAFDEGSGGWGSIREISFVTLEGQTLRFMTTLAGLGVQTERPFGFGYMALTYGDSRDTHTQDGFWGYCTSGQRCDLTVPLPSTFWAMLFGLIGLGGLMAWRRSRA